MRFMKPPTAQYRYSACVLYIAELYKECMYVLYCAVLYTLRYTRTVVLIRYIDREESSSDELSIAVRA